MNAPNVTAVKKNVQLAKAVKIQKISQKGLRQNRGRKRVDSITVSRL